VIEDHVVSYRISGRKLVPTSTEKNGRADASAVIFADPDFNLSHVSHEPSVPRYDDLLASRSAQIAGRFREIGRVCWDGRRNGGYTAQLTNWLGNKPPSICNERLAKLNSDS